MKKILTLLFALVATVGANAATRTQYLDLSQYEIYSGQGSYDNTTYVITPSGAGQGGDIWLGQEDATNYGQVVLELAEASSVPTYVYVEYNQLKEGSETEYERASFTIAAGDTKNSIDLAYNKIIRKIEIKCGDTYVENATIKLKSLYLSYVDNLIESTKTLWADSDNPITFASDYNTGKELEQSLFTNCQAGDRIRVHVSAITGGGTWNTVDLCNKSWSSFTPETKYVLMGREVAPLDVEFTLTEDMVNIIKGNTSTNGGICMRGANYTMDKISLVRYIDGDLVDLTKEMDSYWDSSYNPETKTITWTNAEGKTYSWGGCGWWYGGKDCSGYSKVVYEFAEAAPAAGGLTVEYATTGIDNGYVGFEKGATSVEYTYDAARNHNVAAMYLKLAEAGSIKLKQIYFVKGTAPMSTTSITRTTATDTYGTICLPYNATATGATVMTFKGRSEQGLVFEPVADKVTLTAGVPYLYRATADSQTFTYDQSSTYAAATAENNFTGVYTDKELTAGQYFLYTNDNTFHPAANAEDASETYVYARAYKCYFPELPQVTIQDSGARSVVFGIFVDETTGLQSINTSVNLNKNGKFLENGRLVIYKNNNKYNAAGQLVK